MVESCVRSAGFSADGLLMDRHGALAMSQDEICFGVYADGVCAVLETVKVTLDAIGLQCSEVESDTSKQVFTGLQLDHKTGVFVAGSLSHLAAAAWSGVCCTTKASHG